MRSKRERLGEDGVSARGHDWPRRSSDRGFGDGDFERDHRLVPRLCVEDLAKEAFAKSWQLVRTESPDYTCGVAS